MTASPFYFGWAAAIVFVLVGAAFLMLNIYLPRIIEIGLLMRRDTLRPKNSYARKLETYECGEDPVGDAWIRFNPRFFIVGLIFVLFDVEILFLYPWAVALRGVKEGIPPSAPPGASGLTPELAFADMMVFVAVLLVGFAYLWRYGYLEWIKTVRTQRPEVS